MAKGVCTAKRGVHGKGRVWDMDSKEGGMCGKGGHAW